MKNIFLILTTIFCASSIIAQKSSTLDKGAIIIHKKGETDWANFEKGLKTKEVAMVFYPNKQGNILFIDFAVLGKKLERLELKSHNNILIKEDNSLFDLPMNTIYELNLEKLQRGTYIVLLYTFEDDIIQKQIIIK